MARVTRRRLPVVRAKTYPVLVACVEEGASYGVMRAFKYADEPDRDIIAEHVSREILALLGERLLWDDQS